MVANSFLSRLGLTLAKFPSDDRVDVVPVPEQEKQENPKISPYGYEVTSSLNATSSVGTDIFVRVSDDADNPSSGWFTVDLDDDGDPTIILEINDKTWLTKPVYFDDDGALTLIPNSVKRIDDDGDIVIDVKGYLQLNGFKSSVLKLTKPEPTPDDWYHCKFHFIGGPVALYNEDGVWRELYMPLCAKLEIGYYIFI